MRVRVYGSFDDPIRPQRTRRKPGLATHVKIGDIHAHQLRAWQALRLLIQPPESCEIFTRKKWRNAIS